MINNLNVRNYRTLLFFRICTHQHTCGVFRRFIYTDGQPSATSCGYSLHIPLCAIAVFMPGRKTRTTERKVVPHYLNTPQLIMKYLQIAADKFLYHITLHFQTMYLNTRKRIHYYHARPQTAYTWVKNSPNTTWIFHPLITVYLQTATDK